MDVVEWLLDSDPGKDSLQPTNFLVRTSAELVAR